MVEVEGKARVRCGRGGDTCEEISSALPSRDSDRRTCEDDGGETFAVEILSGHDEEGECFELIKISWSTRFPKLCRRSHLLRTCCECRYCRSCRGTQRTSASVSTV
jgi:hypothetical protein